MMASPVSPSRKHHPPACFAEMPCSLGRQRIDLLACSGTRRRCRPTRRHLRHRPAIQASVTTVGRLGRVVFVDKPRAGNRRPRSGHRPSPHRLGWRCNRSSSLQPRGGPRTLISGVGHAVTVDVQLSVGTAVLVHR